MRALSFQGKKVQVDEISQGAPINQSRTTGLESNFTARTKLLSPGIKSASS